MRMDRPNCSFSLNTSLSSSLNGSLNFQTPSSPQGKFVQRLCYIEEENKVLKTELSGLKKWKIAVEAWLLESFGFVADFNKTDDDNDSVSSNVSHDTNTGPCNLNTTTNFAIIKLEGANEAEVGETEQVRSEEPQVSTSVSDGLPDKINTVSASIEQVCNNSDGEIISVQNMETPIENGHHQLQTKNKNSHEQQQETSDVRVNQSESNQESEKLSQKRLTPFYEVIKGPLFHKKNNASKSTEQLVNNADCVETDATPCDVCRSHIPEDLNNMIYCDTCNICVHQACYGVAKIPKGEWNCQACVAKIPVEQQQCRFCTIRGGAMVRVKTPNNSSWAHVSCTWWIPGVHINNPLSMDIVVGMPNVEKRRWLLNCYICKQGKGKTCCIQCSYKKCTVSFHVTCAFKESLRMEMIDDDNAPDGILLYSFCQLHRNKGTQLPASGFRQKSQNETPQKKKRKLEGK